MDNLLQKHPKRSITQAEVLKFSNYPMDIFRSTLRLQDSTTKSSGACQTRDSGTAHGHEIF
jgi:hypothetical protein